MGGNLYYLFLPTLFSSPSVRDEWLEAISNAIEEHNMKQITFSPSNKYTEEVQLLYFYFPEELTFYYYINILTIYLESLKYKNLFIQSFHTL